MTAFNEQDSAVLSAIGRGINNLNDIAEECGMSESLTNQVLRRLIAHGRIRAERQPGERGVKRTAYAVIPMAAQPEGVTEIVTEVAQGKPVKALVASGIGVFMAMAQQLGGAA